EPEILRFSTAPVCLKGADAGHPDDPPDIELIGHLIAMLKAGGAFPTEPSTTTRQLLTTMTAGSVKAGSGEFISPDLASRY
ncbi:MAG: hypothetical protein ACKVPY_17295, partial [Paracoccaceae bacterium]